MAKVRKPLEPLGLKKLISDTNGALIAKAKVKPDRKTVPHALIAEGTVRGLYLRIQPSAIEGAPPAASWMLRYMLDGRPRSMGLGYYDAHTNGVAKARERARAARSQLLDGQDPIDQREAARAARLAEKATRLTFKEAAAKLIASKRDGWSQRSTDEWGSSLETYAYPLIGNLSVAEIDNGAILRVLQQPKMTADGKSERLWTAVPDRAKKLQNRIEAVLGWSIAGGYRTADNPAKWDLLKHQLPAKSTLPRGKVKHHPALPIDAVPEFVTRLAKVHGMGARALEFAILTAARSGEVRGATWPEIELDANLWTIPGSRMKAGREHRVPLSEPALAVLRALHELRASDDAFVFPAARGGQLSDMTLSAVMRRMGVDAVPHGFRSTFRDWGSERTNFPSEMLEMALAHTVSDKVEAAYRRGDLFDKRVALMDAWGRFCEGEAGENVLQFPPAEHAA